MVVLYFHFFSTVSSLYHHHLWKDEKKDKLRLLFNCSWLYIGRWSRDGHDSEP